MSNVVASETSAKATMTTIKVPKPLRQRIASAAASEGVTAAAFLAGLLDRYERDQRFAHVRRAYAGEVDGDYAELTEAWDRAAAPDLDAARGLDGA